MQADCHVGDIGTQFILEIRDELDAIVDLSTASSLQMVFKNQTDAKVTKTATLYTDGKDGKIKYVTINGDLNRPGQWQIQAQVVIADATWSSDIGSFRVAANL